LKAWIFIPSDLEPAKILGTQVFGAELVRINAATTTSIACARRSPMNLFPANAAGDS